MLSLHPLLAFTVQINVFRSSIRQETFKQFYFNISKNVFRGFQCCFFEGVKVCLYVLANSLCTRWRQKQCSFFSWGAAVVKTCKKSLRSVWKDGDWERSRRALAPSPIAPRPGRCCRVGVWPGAGLSTHMGSVTTQQGLTRGTIQVF